MGLSTMQPGAPAAEASILAAFMPANIGSAAGSSGLFESLLEDALGLAAPADPPVEASESAATVDGNGAVVANAGSESNSTASIPSPGKDGAHKKADFKGAGGDNAGTAALYALTMATVAAEPLQKLDRTAIDPAMSNPALQAQQNSAAQVLAIAGSGTQAAGWPQSGASAALKKIETVGVQLPTSADGPSPKAAGVPVGQAVALPEPEPPTGQPVPQVAETPQKKDGPNLEAGAEGFLSRNTQSDVEGSSPAAQLQVPKTSQHVQPSEGQKAAANVPDHAALTTATITAITTSPNQSRSTGAVPDAQSLSAQAGLGSAVATNVSVDAGASLVASATPGPNSIVSSTTLAPVSDQSGKDAPRVEVLIVPLPQPQLPAQLQPQPQTQTQLQAPHLPQVPQLPPTQAPQTQPSPTQVQAGPKGMHSPHAFKQGTQPAPSEPMQGEGLADGLKSAAADILIRASAPHHSVINSHSAGNAPSPKAEAATAGADSAPANSTTASDEDRKSGAPSGQASPAQQSAPAATAAAAPAAPAAPATSVPVPPVVSPAANAPAAPPAGVPAATSQTLPASPLQTLAPRPGAHDLPAAMPDPAAPVQVSAARIVQTDSRAGMRLDMQTQSFGGVEVHTSVAGRDVQLSVSAEHGDLHSFLAPEMPVLQSQLQQHDLRLQQVRTVLNYGTQQEFSSGSGRQEQRFARPQTRPGAFDSQNITGSPDEEDSPKGLSIRI